MFWPIDGLISGTMIGLFLTLTACVAPPASKNSDQAKKALHRLTALSAGLHTLLLSVEVEMSNRKARAVGIGWIDQCVSQAVIGFADKARGATSIIIAGNALWSGIRSVCRFIESWSRPQLFVRWRPARHSRWSKCSPRRFRPSWPHHATAPGSPGASMNAA